MSLRLNPKPSLAQFIETCTPLAIIPTLEEEFNLRVARIADAMMAYTSSDDPLENLAAFLQADRDFLGIILVLTNLSQEKFLRVLSAERFASGDYEPEWTRSRNATGYRSVGR